MVAEKTVCQIVIVVIALFLTGSANTILTKVLLTTQAEGVDGKLETFQKPFFGTVNMFFAMVLVMPFYWISKVTAKDHTASLDLSSPLLQQSAPQPTGAARLKPYLLIFLPSFLDLLSMCFMLVGMLFLPASIWQMLRGANIVFAAILSIIILKRKLYAFHWIGVGLAIVGISAVAMASVKAENSDESESADGDSGRVGLGVGIVVFAQLIQAAQIILEEELLNGLDMDPIFIVGMEGFWGLLCMALVMPVLYYLPGSDHGHLEDTVDTFAFISNSQQAQYVVAAYMVSVATYNIAGMMVTSALSGVMRVMLEATRTLTIWIFNLAWYYLVNPKSAFAEEWTNWSYLQLVGFLILVIGQGTYGQKLKWSCLWYPPEEPSDEAKFASPGAIRAGTFASPSTPGVVREGAFASPKPQGK